MVAARGLLVTSAVTRGLLVMCCLLMTSAATGAPLQQGEGEWEGGATETQHAICVVTSADAVATARATITRVINSSCDDRNMERLSKLEKDIADQNEMIRYLLHLMEMQYNENHDNMYFRSPVDSLKYKRQEDTLDNYSPLQSAEPTSTREAEVDRYNSSLLTDPQGRLTFNYYWRVHRALEMPENTTVRSQSFYVSSGSYRMFLSYWAGTFLHMAGIGITRGERDALLQWPFNLRIRLSILAQNHRKDYVRDLSSASIKPAHFARCQTVHWQKPRTGDNPSCFVLIYSRDLLHSDGYLHKGAVLLHLSVLLAE